MFLSVRYWNTDEKEKITKKQEEKLLKSFLRYTQTQKSKFHVFSQEKWYLKQ